MLEGDEVLEARVDADQANPPRADGKRVELVRHFLRVPVGAVAHVGENRLDLGVVEVVVEADK